jgi:hypothetical protein
MPAPVTRYAIQSRRHGAPPGSPRRVAQTEVRRQIQDEAFASVLDIPIGEYLQPTAYNPSLSGRVNGCPIFWGVGKP